MYSRATHDSLYILMQLNIHIHVELDPCHLKAKLGLCSHHANEFIVPLNYFSHANLQAR